MTGYCPNCGRAIEHDGRDAECEPCQIRWNGGAASALRSDPYAPGELEAEHAEILRRFREGNPGAAIL
jgi:hypothetical protein